MKLFVLFLFFRVSIKRNLLFLAREVGVLVNFAQNMLHKVSMAVAPDVELPLREGQKSNSGYILCPKTS